MSRYSLIFDADDATATDALPAAALGGVSLAALPSTCRHSRYNIGRNQDIIVLCAADDDQHATPIVARAMRWGFTPHWIHSPNPALQPLTVPDTKLHQPYFRDAFRQRRCLIPASGFYAWQGWENGPAAPFYVRMRDHQPFYMAGIWDSCEGIDRVAMITTGANALLRPIHERMPAIIATDAMEDWLRGERARDLIAPYAAAAMEIHQVGRKVFSLQNDSPDLIAPLPCAPARASA